MGPMVYEQNESDDFGDALGGINLPFDLPVNIEAQNFAAMSVPGRLRTRALRWGGFARKVKGCVARGSMESGTALALDLMVRTPNDRTWTGQRLFAAEQFEEEDVALRKVCGERGIEAQVEIRTTAGRPVVRSVMVETAVVGKAEE